MIDDINFESSDHFFTWWEAQNPNDVFDMNEAMTIFFNTETYDLGAI